MMQSPMPPWIQEDQSKEAEDPEVNSTPFQLFSGENMLSGCLCVKVQVLMLCQWVFLRKKSWAFSGFLWHNPLEPYFGQHFDGLTASTTM